MGTQPTKEAIIGTYINGRNAQDDFLQLATNHGGTVFGWIDSNGHLQGSLLVGTGGGGTPSGSDTDIQFNNNGVFGGNSGFTFVYADAVAPVLTPLGTVNISASGNDNNPIIELFGTGTGPGNGPYMFFTPTTGAGNTGTTRATVALIGIDQTGGMVCAANQNGRDAGGMTLQGSGGDVPGALEVGVFGVINPNALTELFYNPDGGIDFYLNTEGGPGLSVDGNANTSWINLNSATALLNQNSPILSLNGDYWNGSGSATDTWTVQGVLGAGANPTSELNFVHSGSGGNPNVNIPYPLSTGVISSAGMTAAGNINILNGNMFDMQSSNAAAEMIGQSSELITLSTGGTTTDSTTNLLPAGAIIDAVVARVTTTISGGSTPTTWEAGDATTAARFISTGTTLTAGSTAIGLNQMQGGISTNATGPVQTAAAKVRITLDQTPGQGQIRITVFWRQFSAPSS